MHVPMFYTREILELPRLLFIVLLSGHSGVRTVRNKMFGLNCIKNLMIFLVMRISIVIRVEGMVYMFKAKVFNKKKEV